MNLTDIYEDIRSSFGKLWSFKMRGKSLEVITPFATTSHTFVSVFITRRDDELVVTDGGWIGEGVYEVPFDRDDEYFSKIILHYQYNFDIKETRDAANRPFFYKKTKSAKAVPSILFDLANFITAVVSTAAIEFEDKTEKETKTRFGKQVNDYLSTVFDKDKLVLGGSLDNSGQIKVNAIYRKTPSRIALINYITGSSIYYFNNSVTKANFVFELAEKTEINRFVDKRICLLDDYSVGYVPNKVHTYLKHLETNTNSKLIPWSRKELIQEIA